MIMRRLVLSIKLEVLAKQFSVSKHDLTTRFMFEDFEYGPPLICLIGE